MSPRHHTVPRFYLRGFANAADQVTLVARDDRHSRSGARSGWPPQKSASTGSRREILPGKKTSLATTLRTSKRR